MTTEALFKHAGLMTLVGSYLSPKKADALFRLFFSKHQRFSLFVQAVREHTLCDRDSLRFIGRECYAPDRGRDYLTIIKGCLPHLRELDFSTFKEPGNLALQLAGDDSCAPIVYHSRYHLINIKGEELRKVIDTLQNRPYIFLALQGEGITDKEKLKIALFAAIFQKCNSAQAEECFPWAVRGPIAITDEEGRKKIVSQVKRINSEIVAQFHADISQSQSDQDIYSLSQKRPVSPSAAQSKPKRQKKGKS